MRLPTVYPSTRPIRPGYRVLELFLQNPEYFFHGYSVPFPSNVYRDEIDLSRIFTRKNFLIDINFRTTCLSLAQITEGNIRTFRRIFLHRIISSAYPRNLISRWARGWTEQGTAAGTRVFARVARFTIGTGGRTRGKGEREEEEEVVAE